MKFSCKHTNWDNIKYDLDEKIIPFLRSRGATKFGTIGTCWGGYNIIRFLYLYTLYCKKTTPNVTICRANFLTQNTKTMGKCDTMFLLCL